MRLETLGCNSSVEMIHIKLIYDSLRVGCCHLHVLLRSPWLLHYCFCSALHPSFNLLVFVIPGVCNQISSFITLFWWSRSAGKHSVAHKLMVDDRRWPLSLPPTTMTTIFLNSSPGSVMLSLLPSHNIIKMASQCTPGSCEQKTRVLLSPYLLQ